MFPTGVNVANWSTDTREAPIYRGTWDPKTAAYPTTHGDKNSRWDVVFDAATPTVSYDGKTWRPGDRLVYTKDTKKFSQMHSTLGVPSVNGKTGSVVLTADDVGAMKHTTSAVVDCDDLKKAGSFGVAGGSANWAFGTTAGALMVFFHNSTYMTQLACSAGDNKMRVRTCNANKWSSWVKVYTEFEKPTAEEVKAPNLNYGVGAAGKDIADMNVPELKGGIFNSAANSAGAYANYMPFIQGVRPGGSDGSGQMLQMQANHLTKKFAYRTRVEGNWTDWVEPYSKYNLPTATDVKAMVRKEWDGDFDTL
ncbi:MAG: pyocin knob domain-containing protein, partial [Fusobacteriaceae bacterium]